MSRTPRSFAVFGFSSTHDALAAEDLLQDAGIEAVPIPAPTLLGALCGIALRVPEMASEQARSRMEEGGVEPSGIILMDDV